jgi:hypothetical protein
MTRCDDCARVTAALVARARIRAGIARATNRKRLMGDLLKR